MREPRWKALLRKSISACVAAIEIYNKPVMPHRDETFAMLAVNAWELLLKARLLREANNKQRSIQVRVPVTGKNGRSTKRFKIELNGAKNPRTITIGEAAHRVSNLPTQKLDPACAASLWSLIEIRDNAVHFVNEDDEMRRRTHEAGSACLRNYAAAVAEWFDHDLSEHRFMILPLSFEGAGGGALAIPARRPLQVANLIAYLDRAAETAPATTNSPYAAAIRVETRIVGSRAKDAAAFRLGGGPEAPEVRLTEEEIRSRWPMNYAGLQKATKAKLPDVKFNQSFNAAVKTLKGNQKFMHRRLLDPGNANSSRKDFYSDAAVDAVVRVLRPGSAAA